MHASGRPKDEDMGRASAAGPCTAMTPSSISRWLLPAIAIMSFPMLAIGVNTCPGEGRFQPTHDCGRPGVFKVCAHLLVSPQSSALLKWGSKDYFAWMNQPDPSAAIGMMKSNGGDHACVSMMTFASVVQMAGCDNVHFMCAATDVPAILVTYSQKQLVAASNCIAKRCSQSQAIVAPAAPAVVTSTMLQSTTSSPGTSPLHSTLPPTLPAFFAPMPVSSTTTTSATTTSVTTSATTTSVTTLATTATVSPPLSPTAANVVSGAAPSLSRAVGGAPAVGSGLPKVQGGTPVAMGSAGHVSSTAAPPGLIPTTTSPILLGTTTPEAGPGRPAIFEILTNVVIILAISIFCVGLCCMVYQHSGAGKTRRSTEAPYQQPPPPARQSDSHYSQYGGGWGAFGPPDRPRGSFNGQGGSFDRVPGSSFDRASNGQSFPPQGASFGGGYGQSAAYQGGYAGDRREPDGGGYGPPPPADSHLYRPPQGGGGTFRHDAYRNPDPAEAAALLRR